MTSNTNSPRIVEFTSHHGTTWRVHIDDVMFGKPWAETVEGKSGGRFAPALLPKDIRDMLPKGPFDR